MASTSRFDTCLAFVLNAEGGLTDDPADPGGRTNKGIEQREYNRYRAQRNEPRRDVADISDDEVRDIYLGGYWTACHASEIPAPLDLVVFDCAVNQGNGRAMTFLARALGVSAAAAHWTPGLAAHIQAIVDPKALAASVIAIRLASYESLIRRRPSLVKFLHGWENRLHALKIACGLIAE